MKKTITIDTPLSSNNPSVTAILQLTICSPLPAGSFVVLVTVGCFKDALQTTSILLARWHRVLPHTTRLVLKIITIGWLVSPSSWRFSQVRFVASPGTSLKSIVGWRSDKTPSPNSLESRNPNHVGPMLYTSHLRLLPDGKFVDGLRFLYIVA